MLLLLLATAVRAEPAPATPESPAAVAEVAPDPSFTEVLGFEEDLHVRSDLMLQGLSATQSVPFTLPRDWKLTKDPVLDLVFDHSASLLPERSNMNIRVNGASVATVILAPGNAAEAHVTARIPRALLTDFNSLQIEVVQHVTDDCEDPFDPSLWTRVSRASTITMTAERLPITPELLEFPFPFADDRAYGPSRITLVGDGTFKPAQVEALGALGFAIGRHAAYHQVEVSAPVARLEDLQTNGLVVGIVGQDRILTEFNLPTLAAGDGLVAITPAPGHPELAVLVVAGADAEGLGRATSALAAQDRYPVLSGAASQISAVTESSPPPNRAETVPAPRRDEDFTLKDLRFADTTVRGYYAEPIRVPVDLEGDALARPGARLRLHYSHSALVNPRISAVEVRLNGVVLRSRHLDDQDDQRQTMEVELPAEVLAPHNELEVFFHLFPMDFDACHLKPDRQLWGTVFADTELHIPRDNYARMPDLSRMEVGLWPLSLDAADGGTTIVLDDAPDVLDASAGFQLAADFGRISTVDAPRFAMTAGGKSLAELGTGNVVLVVSGDDPHRAWTDLVASGGVTLAGGPERLLGPAAALLKSVVGTPYGTVEQVMRPGEEARAVLIVRASGESLVTTTRNLFDPALIGRLAGNASVLTATEDVRPLHVAQQVAVGKLTPSSRFRTMLSDAWPAIGITVPLAALFATLVIGRWARARGGHT